MSQNRAKSDRIKSLVLGFKAGPRSVRRFTWGMNGLRKENVRSKGESGEVGEFLCELLMVNNVTAGRVGPRRDRRYTGED